MLKLKPGVSLRGLQPPILVALQVAEGVYREIFHRDCWVTSGNDGKHRTGSFHYRGLAVDLRVHNLPDAKLDAPRALAHLREGLGGEFDVLLEGAGTPNAHLHVEFDPD
jgi:hypothetical protein